MFYLFLKIVYNFFSKNYTVMYSILLVLKKDLLLNTPQVTELVTGITFAHSVEELSEIP